MNRHELNTVSLHALGTPWNMQWTAGGGGLGVLRPEHGGSLGLETTRTAQKVRESSERSESESI